MTAIETAQPEGIVVEVPTPPAGEAQTNLSPDTGPQKPRTPVRRRVSKRAIVVASTAVISGLAIWFFVYALLLTGLQEHGSQARLFAKYREQLAAATAPLGGPIQAGSPVALITGPGGGLHNVVVVQGTGAKQLESGPGHLADTPLPGQTGTSVLLGRSVTFGGPFGAITKMKTGQDITVTTGQGVFVYRVEDIRHPGAPLPQPLGRNQSRITLVTATSRGWRSGWAPAGAVYVDAILARGTAQPIPAGLATTVSKSALPMQGDPDAIVPLVFWLEGLVLVAAAMAWSWIRWGRRQTWIAGIPVLLAMLWGASATLELFLPNLV